MESDLNPTALTVADLMEQVPAAPAVTASAPAPSSPSPQGSAVAPVTDDAGTVFDPQRHASNADGSPRYLTGIRNRGRKLFASKRGAGAQPKASAAAVPQVKPAATGGTPAVPPAPAPGLVHPDPEPVAAAPAVDPVRLEAAAVSLVGLEQSLALAFFGEEWVFLREEQQSLVGAYVRMMEKTGAVESPWWADLLAVHAALYIRRMDKPQTRERVQTLKVWALKTWTTLRAWWAASARA